VLGVYRNISLTNVDLPSLLIVAGDVEIGDNAALSSLSGLSSLTSVSGALRIYDNPCLSPTEAEAFAASIEVGGDIEIYDNGSDYPCD